MSNDIQIKIFATQSQASAELQKLLLQGFKVILPTKQAEVINWINKASGDASAVAFDKSDVDGVWMFAVER